LLGRINDTWGKFFHPGYGISLPTNVSQWVACAAAIPVVFVQCFFEEAWFRGLLPQMVFKATDSVSKTMIIGALAFGAMHFGYFPTGISVGWLILPLIAVLQGAALLRAMWISGGIELSLGLHFANNFWGMAGDKMLWEKTNTELDVGGALVSALLPLLWVLLLEVWVRLRQKGALRALSFGI
jgi:membrane protease YdiL (CAAX protease family)